MDPSIRSTYNKVPGFATTSGIMYEVKMCCIIFVRAFRLTEEFYIATNMTEAGAFDDIVLIYKCSHCRIWKKCFIQMKHKTSKKDIGFQNLVALSGNFSLPKYCKSYSQVKHVPVFQICCDNNSKFEADFSESEFIIFTNSLLNLQKKQESECNTHTLLNTNSDSSSVVTFGDIFSQDCSPAYDHQLCVEVSNYFEDLVKCKKHLDYLKSEKQTRRQILEHIKEFRTEVNKYLFDKLDRAVVRNEIDNFHKDLQGLEDYKEFLQNLSLFVGQANEKELDEILHGEIKNLLHTSVTDTKAICMEMLQHIERWRDRETYFLTKTATFWQEMIAGRRNQLSKSKRNEMEALGVRFDKDHLLSLPATGVVNIVTHSTLLSCVRVCQSLEDHYIVIGQESLLQRRQEVLALWPSDCCRTLVVDWEFGQNNIVDLWTQNTEHRLIIVSESTLNIGHTLRDRFDFSQLDESSQHNIGKTEIIFQGFPVSFNSLILKDMHKRVNESLLSELLSNKKVEIGNDITHSLNHFIPRSMKHHIYIRKEILSGVGTSALFALSGVRKDLPLLYDVHNLYILNYHSSNAYEFIPFDQMRAGPECSESNIRRELNSNTCEFVVIRNSSDFDFLCEKRENIHWLEIEENTKLKWKASKGDITLLQKFVDDSDDVFYNYEQLTGISERIILLIAEPGMGKTTLMKNLASSIKKSNSSQWVLPIALNDHTKLLNRMERHSHMMNVKEILKEVACANKSKLESLLFSEVLRDMQDIVVMFDAVDEISPDYTDLVYSLVKAMINKGVSQIWLTSRPVMKIHLENELHVLSYTLEPFSTSDQISFLVNYWCTHNEQLDKEVATEFANNLIQITTEDILDNKEEFMAVPLHTRLMAESFNSHLKVYKETGSLNLPEKLNVIELFHFFVKQKFSILFEEKRQIDTTKPSNKQDFEKQYKEFEEVHMVCSLIVIFTESECRLLKPDSIITQARSNCIKIEEGFEQTGIIDMIKNGIPHFIHRSFADHFCVQWIIKNYDENKDFLKKNLHRQELKIVWKMLNYIVSEGHNLHIAVLNNDMQKMKTLLDDGIEVDQTDAWGRSALHLAAACNYRNAIELLLKYDADMTIRDSLGCDPLDYCERTTSWASLDLLLSASKGQRDDQLPFLKENINNAAFGIQALRESTEYGHVYLAEFLLNNGLDLETILNEENQQVLHIASRNNQEKIINLVLESSTVTTKHNYKRRNEEQIDKIVNTKDKSGWTPLLYASHQGNLDIVQTLIKHKADKSFRNESGECALYLAARESHLPVVKYLVEHGADIQLGDNNEYTPLHKAIAGGHLSVVDFLVQNGARINLGSYCGETPIYVAALNGHLPIVKYLAENGADINKCTTYDHTPLHMAAWFGHPSVVEFLVQNGANIETQNKGGQTALCYAIDEGLVTIVDYLLQNGANIHFRDWNRQTSLHKAAYHGHLHVAKCLLQHGANVNEVDVSGQTPLHLAAKQGYLDIVDYLLTYKVEDNDANNSGCTARNVSAQQTVDIDICDKLSHTSLHKAAYYGHLPVVKCLLQHGANVNAVDILGQTPLHLAAKQGHFDIVKYLFTQNVQAEIGDNCGYTALHLAAYEGHLSVVECLAQNEALINLGEDLGYSPLHFAAEEGDVNIVKCLLRNKADVNLQNNDGITALHLAAEEGHVFVVQCLLDNEALVNIPDKTGNIPLRIAVEERHWSVVNCLLRRGSYFRMGTIKISLRLRRRNC
ncbi:uncharacterized protein [Periplaneta americana]|uniref:uncharacterized protein isoform X1 n=2 Tax=Periplaneta americana TaxID=6978 RepID=UPI0037E81611